jgi:hypothetical protein
MERKRIPPYMVIWFLGIFHPILLFLPVLIFDLEVFPTPLLLFHPVLLFGMWLTFCYPFDIHFYDQEKSIVWGNFRN